MSVSFDVTAGRVAAEATNWCVAGRAIDLRGVVDLQTVREATDAWAVCDEPLSLRDALARAARSWEKTAPQDDRIAEINAELAELDASATPNLTAIRREVAENGEQIDRLREQAAVHRGRLQARRAACEPTDAVEAELKETIRRLTELETKRVAAEQRLERAEQRTRETRDRHERRLQLRDELHNRRRDARKALAARLYEPFAAVVRELPGSATPGRHPGEYTGGAVVARLGVAAVAAGERPAALTTNPFTDLATAARRVAAPVVRVAE